MKTDTLFYRIFQLFPHLLFVLMGKITPADYQFTAVEVKQKAFRFDRLFLPPPDNPDLHIYFLEVQFQTNPHLCWEL